jgi:sulfur relay (sulfurtransferase) DsrC/TusE family protein
MSQSDGEVVRALDLADGYLSDAEEVLWAVTEEVEGERVEELTEELWRLQHRLRDFRAEVDD